MHKVLYKLYKTNEKSIFRRTRVSHFLKTHYYLLHKIHLQHQQTLNLPSIDANIVNNPGAAGSFSNLTTADKLRILFPQG